MFYERQSKNQRNNYKQMLALVGSLSNLFSDSDKPLLHYRAHENIFCKYFEALNLSRDDCSADAIKDKIGIGLKTWVGQDDQKIAEFGRLRPSYEHLSGIELIKAIASYRNTRIQVTKNLHGLREMIYHIIKRVPNAMKIYECAFDYIDVENIVIDEARGHANNVYFSDGRHTYHFSKSKNTLYMIFEKMDFMDSFEVEILDDPFEVLKQLLLHEPCKALTRTIDETPARQLCLRLYNVLNDGTKFVPQRSGLNQWNAKGRKRDENELYIAYLAKDRERDETFFPPRDTPFTLLLPDGTSMSAKVCQGAFTKVRQEMYNKMTDREKEIEDSRTLVGKSIMSNPNKTLGKWLLRDVFEVPVGTLITYDMLCQFGVDSVIFTKISNNQYSVDFAPLGTYERMYGEKDLSTEHDSD